MGEAEFVHGPNAIADGPEERTGADEKPEDADARMTTQEILEAEDGGESNERDLQGVSEGGQRKAFGKDERNDYGR